MQPPSLQVNSSPEQGFWHPTSSLQLLEVYFSPLIFISVCWLFGWLDGLSVGLSLFPYMARNYTYKHAPIGALFRFKRIFRLQRTGFLLKQDRYSQGFSKICMEKSIFASLDISKLYKSFIQVIALNISKCKYRTLWQTHSYNSAEDIITHY